MDANPPTGVDQGGTRVSPWSAPVLLGIGGVLGFWGSLIAALVLAAPEKPSRVALGVVGCICAMAIIAHLIGTAIALIGRRGNWKTGAIMNVVPLAVLTGMIVFGLSLKR